MKLVQLDQGTWLPDVIFYMLYKDGGSSCYCIYNFYNWLCCSRIDLLLSILSDGMEYPGNGSLVMLEIKMKWQMKKKSTLRSLAYLFLNFLAT